MQLNTARGHDGLEIAASVAGPADGALIILSHGGGQTRHAWGAAVAELASKGFHVWALDLRGHGDSAWSPSGHYNIEDYAADIRAIATQLDRPALLVGASLGGIASTLAAGEPPGLAITGLVLVDIAANLKAAGVDSVVGFMERTRRGFDTFDDVAVAIAEYLPQRRRDGPPVGLEKNTRVGDDGRIYWHWDPAMMDRLPVSSEIGRRLDAAAANVAAPALLLRGGKSELVDRDSAETFMSKFARGRTIDIPGARHMVAGDQNDQFIQALKDFALEIRDSSP